MTDQYKKIMELWEAKKFSDAISRFRQWMSEGSLSQKEIESFNRYLAEFWELVELESQRNAEVLFTSTLHKKLKNDTSKLRLPP